MFVDSLKRASISYHTTHQLRSVLKHEKAPTVHGFVRHLHEYKKFHEVVHKPLDLYTPDIIKDLATLWDPEFPVYDTTYAEYVVTLPPHVQGTHWYIVSCAHASGGQSYADALGFSSAFLQKRDITPLKTIFDIWTVEWTETEKQECLEAVPDIFEHATRVNKLIYL